MVRLVAVAAIITSIGCTDYQPGDYKSICCVAAAVVGIDSPPPQPPGPEPSEWCVACGGDGILGDGTITRKCIACDGDGTIDPDDPGIPEDTPGHTDRKPLQQPLYKEAVEESRSTNTPLVLVFSTQGCAACEVLKESYTHVSREGYVLCFVSGRPDLEQLYKVRAFPTQVVTHGGYLFDRRVGAMTSAEIDRWRERVFLRADNYTKGKL